MTSSFTITKSTGSLDWLYPAEFFNFIITNDLSKYLKKKKLNYFIFSNNNLCKK